MKKQKESIETVTRESKEYVFVHYTQDELNEKAQELAKKTLEKDTLETRKKSTMATCAANIAECAARVNVLSINLSDGGEDRYVDCVWHLNTPKPGRKTLYKKEDGLEVRQTSMEQSDFQLTLEEVPDKGVADKIENTTATQ